MANFELVMPKLGESIIEATITRWLKQPGDMIEEDDAIVEIATDKVDSEIPSPVEGKLVEVRFKEGDVVEVGKIIAIIDTDASGDGQPEAPAAKASEGTAETKSFKADQSETKQKPYGETQEIPTPAEVSTDKGKQVTQADKQQMPKAERDGSGKESAFEESADENGDSDRFYSPLVKNIAKTEGISLKELDKVKGTGKEGRITKNDLLAYLDDRKKQPESTTKTETTTTQREPAQPAVQAQKATPQVTAWDGDEIVEMDRMRRLIADHMVMSKDVSPHVTSYIEVDVTNMVMWRNKVKDEFFKREKEKLTFTPLFVEAAAQAIKELPGVNASVDGYKVILRKKINIGIAAALPSGNLIVPVVKNADQKNILGLAKDVNSLADKARNNKLNPDDIQGGTFTITNLGTFGSLTGSPIINQPQVAILGLGVIKKKPVVLETETGDVIAIRHMVILSLSYDHRVVDGALGGMFLQKMQQILENFDLKRTI